MLVAWIGLISYLVHFASQITHHASVVEALTGMPLVLATTLQGGVKCIMHLWLQDALLPLQFLWEVEIKVGEKLFVSIIYWL